MWQPVLMICGYFISLLGIAMLFPAALDIYENQVKWSIFISSSIVAIFIGLSLFLANRGKIKDISIQQAYLVTAFSWVSVTILASLPFVFYGTDWSDALFEAASGISTTGASIYANVEELPRSILLWRALLNALGGVGIVIFAIAMLPFLGIGGMQIFQRENSDSANDILTSIERYIREEIDENFDQDNYILEITDSFDKSYYMFSKKVDGAKSNEYFQVVLDKKNNMIIEYHESLNKVQEMYSSNPYNNEVIELAKKEAARIYKDEILKQSEITIYNTKDDTYHLYIVSDLKDANDNLYSEFYEYIMPN